ncbi:MAG: MOSC domain-containing protein [Patescibacteria group bacterium]
MKSAFELRGRVEAVLVTAQSGAVVSETYGAGSLMTTPTRKIQCIRGQGIWGDRHARVRLLDVREKEMLSFGFVKGIEISNLREFSAVSLEELQEIGRGMNLPNGFPHGCLGENLVLSGIPEFSKLPIGTMLFFQKEENQKRSAVLVVWAENMPCRGPGEAIQTCFPDMPDLIRLFPKAAIGKRGVVGLVYSSGIVHEGDTVIVKIPKQEIYDPR